MLCNHVTLMPKALQYCGKLTLPRIHFRRHSTDLFVFTITSTCSHRTRQRPTSVTKCTLAHDLERGEHRGGHRGESKGGGRGEGRGRGG